MREQCQGGWCSFFGVRRTGGEVPRGPFLFFFFGKERVRQFPENVISMSYPFFLRPRPGLFDTPFTLASSKREAHRSGDVNLQVSVARFAGGMIVPGEQMIDAILMEQFEVSRASFERQIVISVGLVWFLDEGRDVLKHNQVLYAILLS